MEVRRNRRFDVGQKVELLYNPIQKLTNGSLGVSTSNYADESFLSYGQYEEDYNNVNISANDVIATPYFGGRVSDTYYNNVTIGLPYDAFGDHSADYLEGYSEIDAYVFKQKTSGYWYCLDGSGYKEEGDKTPNIMVNGDLTDNPFQTPSYTNGWIDSSIGTSVAVWDSGNNTIELVGDGSGSNRGNATARISCVANKTYKLDYNELTAPDNAAIRINSTGAWSDHSIALINPKTNAAPFYFTPSVTGYVYIVFSVYDAVQWEIGNVSVREVENAVVNGDFATDSNWVKGAGWTISGGSANCNGGTSDLYQENSVEVGKEYRITYTISNYVSGSVRVELPSNAYSGITRSANGTYTEVLVAGGTIVLFDARTAFTGSIDNVIVEEVVEYAGGNDNNRILDAYISNVKLKTSNKTFGYGEQLFQNNWQDVVTVQVPANTPEWKLQQLVNSTATAIKGNNDLYNVTPDESEYENTYDTEYGSDGSGTNQWTDVDNYNYYKQFGGGSCSPIVRMTNIDKPSITYNKRKNTISIDLVLLG